MRSGIRALVAASGIAGLGFVACGGNPPPEPGPPDVAILEPVDLETNAQASPRVTWTVPARTSSGATIPDEDVLEALESTSEVVHFPSRTAVSGRWEHVPGDVTNAGHPVLSFVRDEAPEEGWEAVVVDRGAFLDELGISGEGVDRNERIARFSPLSLPIVLELHIRPITESDDGRATGYSPLEAGNEMLGITFSEPVGSLATIHSFVHLELEGRALDCEPHAPVVPQEVPVESIGFQCPPLGDNENLTVRIDPGLVSPAGVSVLEAYGKDDDGELTLDVELSEDDSGRGADPKVLQALANVPPLDAEAP